ncbi:MAG: hypothetical protein WC260_03665 [Candidatus Pacearchaeota archaeon]
MDMDKILESIKESNFCTVSHLDDFTFYTNIENINNNLHLSQYIAKKDYFINLYQNKIDSIKKTKQGIALNIINDRGYVDTISYVYNDNLKKLLLCNYNRSKYHFSMRNSSAHIVDTPKINEKNTAYLNKKNNFVYMNDQIVGYIDLDDLRINDFDL